MAIAVIKQETRKKCCKRWQKADVIAGKDVFLLPTKTFQAAACTDIGSVLRLF